MSNRRFSLDEYATMGLDAITTGALSVEDRIQALDDEVHEQDGAVSKWGVAAYGPGGLAKAVPDDTNTVAQEQTYLKEWAAFFDDWVAEWAVRRRRALADMKSEAFGSGYDELAAKIGKDLDKKKAEFDGMVVRFEKIKAAHGKKQLPGFASEEGFPWGKVLIAVGAIGAIGAALFYLKKKGDEAQAELALANASGAHGLRRPQIGTGDDRPTLIEPAPPGYATALTPPAPLPQLELRNGGGNGKMLSGAAK